MDINKRKQIGTRINAALASANMMQKELAKAIGVTDNTISYFVSGRRVPNTEQIAMIASALHVSADYLLSLTDTPTTDRDVRFISDYTGLSENVIEYLRLCSENGFDVVYFINKLIDESAAVTEEYCRNTFDDEFVKIGKGSLLEAILYYMGADFNLNSDKVYISENGNVIDCYERDHCEHTNNDSQLEYYKKLYKQSKSMTHWKDMYSVTELSKGEIAEQVLRNRIIDAIKKFKESYNPNGQDGE